MSSGGQGDPEAGRHCGHQRPIQERGQRVLIVCRLRQGTDPGLVPGGAADTHDQQRNTRLAVLKKEEKRNCTDGEIQKEMCPTLLWPSLAENTPKEKITLTHTS